jgi:hypothetical protein
MSAFYGLYTWLLLTLFDLQLVYIPSGKFTLDWFEKTCKFISLFFVIVIL